MRGWAMLPALLALSVPAAAVELEDGTVLLGVSAGIGSLRGGSSQVLGKPGILGGQIIYHPIGEWGMGLQVDRFDFKSKGASKADMSSVIGVVRGNVRMGSESLLPYVLLGMGYAESRADIPGGTDHGSGPAIVFGIGADRTLTEHFSAAIEARMNRLAAGLPHLGLAGATVMSVTLRLNFWMAPEPDPFRRR